MKQIDLRQHDEIRWKLHVSGELTLPSAKQSILPPGGTSSGMSAYP